MLSTGHFHYGFLFSWDGRFFYLSTGNISFLVGGFPLTYWALNVVAPFRGFPFGFTWGDCFFFFFIYSSVCVSVGSPFHWAFCLSVGILFLLSK
jgi:hypothetical protein